MISNQYRTGVGNLLERERGKQLYYVIEEGYVNM